MSIPHLLLLHLPGRCRHLTGFVMLAVVTVATSSTQAETLIDYTIRFPQAQNHYAEVELKVTTDGVDDLQLMMPVWTPGSYLIREYARHIEHIAAHDASGASLELHKPEKNRWTVTTGGAKQVVVTYRLYCREMSVRSNWVDNDFALINGAAAFVTPVTARKQKHRVTFELPDDWKSSVSSMESADGGTPHSYVAATYDELVDSPIVCGNPAVYSFKVGDVEHQLVNVGEGGVWDGQKCAADVERLVKEHHQMWGIVPYPRYVFFNLITESGGGLEHDNNTVMMTSRWSYRDREKYRAWLGLVSHEFFHTWNVRRLRPRALVEYDYESEQYIRSLWIAEGITSYYDDLQLVRCGLLDRNQYLKALSQQIERLQTTPGRLVQSLSDSSHDTWIKLYRPDENASNSRVSYYTKGAVAAFLLDAEIREVTDGAKSLDDVMRKLYQEHAGARGYTPEDFRSTVEAIAGDDFDDWFEHAIDSTEELDYQGALQWYGLRFGSEPAASTEKDEKKSEESTPWIGLTAADKAGQFIVSSVQRDSPAFAAGINAEDEILAINDFRVTAGQWPTRVKQYQPGETLRILVARREKLLTLNVVPTEKPDDDWKLEVTRDASAAQAARLNAWLKLSPGKTEAGDSQK
jgi:predicted metalloprotease with PDZ domain